MENTAIKTTVETIELSSVKGTMIKALEIENNEISDYAGGLRETGRALAAVESRTAAYVDDLLNKGYFDADDRKSAEQYMLGKMGDIVTRPRGGDSKVANKPWSLSAARGSEDCPWYFEAKGVFAVLKSWAERLRKMAAPQDNDTDGDGTDGDGEGNESTETPATPADALAMIQNAIKILGADAGEKYKDEVLKIGAILPALQSKINA